LSERLSIPPQGISLVKTRRRITEAVSEPPRDARGRNVDPFDAPDDYADVWRGRRLGILLVGLAVIVLVVVLIIAL
jgi:hypothetical protein